MIASVGTLIFSTHSAQFNIIATAVVMDTNFGQQVQISISDFLKAETLWRLSGFVLPCLIIFRVGVYPSSTLGAQSGLTPATFSSLLPPASCLRCGMSPSQEQLPSHDCQKANIFQVASVPVCRWLLSSIYLSKKALQLTLDANILFKY